MLQDVHKRALRCAAKIIGGNEQLKLHLGVSDVEFVGWFGKRDLPRDIFLRLVDIITDEQGARSAQTSRARRASRQMKTCE